MNLKGSISSKPITVLIDSGVACNFLNPDIAEQLELHVELIEPVKFITASHDQ